MSGAAIPIALPALAERIAARLGAHRLVVALAGPPGAGKSTTAEQLHALLDAAGCRSAILPMDGFHLDNAILDARGLRPRKGAPETFDVAGFAATLARLRTEEDSEVFVPVFDRDADLSRACARAIGPAERIVVAEGNYLLLDRAPWRALRSAFDVTVMLAAERAELRRRLEARWAGYALPPEEIARKVDANDMPNADTVLRESAAADFVVGTG